MGKPEPILREIFRIGENPFSVFLFQHQLAWCPQKKGGEDMSEWINVKLKNVLRAEIIHKMGPLKPDSKCCFPRSPLKKGLPTYPFQVLEVTYAQELKNSEKWIDVRLELNHNDLNILTQWAQTIQYLLAEFDRPKNLLFFVNPYGGRGKAVSIFSSQIQPILQLCQVKSTVIQSKRQNHVSDVLKTMSDDELMSFDAVVAVGGDGTICEVVNGMLTRKLDNFSELKPSPIPVAVIAAGSTNAVAYTMHGTDDPRTGIINTVLTLLGSAVPLDVASVHNDVGLVRFIVGQMSYGYLADLMIRSENLRWMGPKRYKYAGFREFVNHATYACTIDIKSEDTRKILSQCSGTNGCGDCSSSGSPIMKMSGESESSHHQWKKIEGNFVGVSAANMSLRNPMTPLGIAPFAHFSDGFMELILIRKTSRLGHLRYLHRTTGDSRRTFALPFVERYRVREFVFTPMQCSTNPKPSTITLDDIPTKPQTCKCDCSQNKTHSFWNCDGELLFQPSVRVCAHSNLIQILSRNNNQEQETRSPSTGDINDQSQCATISSSLSFTRSPSAVTDEEIDTSLIMLQEDKSSSPSLNDSSNMRF